MAKTAERMGMEKLCWDSLPDAKAGQRYESLFDIRPPIKYRKFRNRGQDDILNF